MLPTRPRLADFDYTGRYDYFLTFCTCNRQPLFTSDDVVDNTLSNILRASTERSFAVPAYVFMPDHFHAVVHGLSESCDLRGYASLAKQRSGFAHRGARKTKLWQPSYYDHVIRPEEGIVPFIAYIVANPVRAGLVARPEDYPYLGSATMSREEMIELVRNVTPATFPR